MKFRLFASVLLLATLAALYLTTTNDAGPAPTGSSAPAPAGDDDGAFKNLKIN